MNRPSVSAGFDPEGLVERPVGRPDVEVGVEHEQRLPDRADDALGEPLGPLDEVLGLPPIGDVSEDHHDADERALLAPDRRGAVVDGDLAAVPGDQQRVVRQASDEPRLDDLADRLLVGLPGLLIDDPENFFEVFAVGLRQRPSGERLGDRVHIVDEAVGIGRQDRVADGGEHHLIPRGGFLGRRIVLPPGH